MKGEDLGRCPFCAGTIGASTDPPATIHSEPPCSIFVQVSPTKFLQLVRSEREKEVLS